MANIFIEAESFDILGGWVIDQQSINQMGSSYIMAHGMGIPVADAKTKLSISESGEWTIYARTRDWTSVWGRGNSAGIFKIDIDGVELQETLGTNGIDWAWQKAGTINLVQGQREISLKDLTGFNARCDAIYMTTDKNDVPPDDFSELEDFRKKNLKLCDDYCNNEYDFVVAGGGIAGICTAYTAASLGLNVALIHDRGVLGGCNSSEVRVGLGGTTHTPPYPNLGNVVDAVSPIAGGAGTYPKDFYEDERKKNIFNLLSQGKIKLSMNESVVGVERLDDDKSVIKALITRNIVDGSEKKYVARFFADCTGDAVVARMMGAETMYGCEAREEYDEELAPEKANKQVMGHSVLWYSKKQEKNTSFPCVDWGIEFNDDTALYVDGGDWEWECGQYRNQVDEIEYIRDYGLMAIYANWSYLKNHSTERDKWSKYKLEWVSPIGGKRESYRVMGDIVLTQNDIEKHIEYPDATGAMTWNIDLHFPDPDNEETFDEPFRSCAYHRGIVNPYPVPYRCLYSKDISNLFLGGRHISVTHVAFSCVRVMRTLGILAEVIGMAASICVNHNTFPRDIYTTHFGKLQSLMCKGVSIPQHHSYNCDDNESYHFKEYGWFFTNPTFSLPVEDEKLMKKIKKLNMIHKHSHKKFLSYFQE